MSTIIECPACQTRYKMTRAIPEGGRSVKCARCGNQWRLIPEGQVEEPIELEEVEHIPGAHAQHGDAPAQPEDISWPAATAEDEEDETSAPPRAEAYESPSWEARRASFAAAIPSLSEPYEHGYGPEAARPEASAPPALEESGEDYETDANPLLAARGAMNAQVNARESLLENTPNAKQEEEDADGDVPAEPAGAALAPEWSPMNRTWREITEKARLESEEDQVDAEAAIRAALKAALEQPGEDAERSQPTAGAEHLADAVKPRFDWPAFDKTGTPPEGEADEAAHDTSRRQSFAMPDRDIEAEEDEEPFRLTGSSARRPIYGAGIGDAAGEADDAAENLAFQNDIEDAFRAGPLPKRPPAVAGDVPPDNRLSEFDRLYDRQGEHPDGASEFDSEFFDREAAAALQAELESGTDVAAYERSRGVGGLALAAGWAVFVSVISGVVLMLVSFRQDIMTALPGTASLYRTIGFAAPDTSGVDFADVTYRWTVAEGKPVIEVKGQVVNVTDRRVTVPRVLINVKDSESTDTVKATATVPTESLEPRERADFTLEFVSPPKSISQIELEFDRTN